MVSVYDYPQVYERAGLQLGHFGCIMLELEPIPVSDILGITERDEDNYDTPYYYSSSDLLRYVRGPVAEEGAHTTLLYGLTPDDNAGIDQKESVDELLRGLDLSSVLVSHIGHFPPQNHEPYACVVAHLQPNGHLFEANRRLRFLPHIDTFVDYRPHVTLAYVRDDELGWVEDRLTAAIGYGYRLKARGINYGGELR